jgi:hypothetical protein
MIKQQQVKIEQQQQQHQKLRQSLAAVTKERDDLNELVGCVSASA